MANDDLQEALQSLTAMLDDIVAEAVGEDLAWQRRDCDPGRLALENIAEVLKVGVAPAHTTMSQLKGGDICSADDLVVGIHIAAHTVRTRILDLEAGVRTVRWDEGERGDGGG